MMQIIESTDDATRVNYVARSSVASFDASADAVDRIYPPPSPEQCYRQNVRFTDLTLPGQVYPGFDVEVPRLE